MIINVLIIKNTNFTNKKIKIDCLNIFYYEYAKTKENKLFTFFRKSYTIVTINLIYATFVIG
jgi:hypothetical protein